MEIPESQQEEFFDCGQITSLENKSWRLKATGTMRKVPFAKTNAGLAQQIL